MGDELLRFWLAAARRLRARTTDAERRLWRELRSLPMYGTHFRRQVSLGPYVADFVCQRAKLVIEVDGSQHGLEHVALRDERRTRWLEAEGYRVLRFWNSEVIRETSSVLERIHVSLYGSLNSEPITFDHPTPPSPPKGRGRRPSPSRGG
jgi:very-short-patch-repair endonuclease